MSNPRGRAARAMHGENLRKFTETRAAAPRASYALIFPRPKLQYPCFVPRRDSRDSRIACMIHEHDHSPKFRSKFSTAVLLLVAAPMLSLAKYPFNYILSYKIYFVNLQYQ